MRKGEKLESVMNGTAEDAIRNLLFSMAKFPLILKSGHLREVTSTAIDK